MKLWGGRFDAGQRDGDFERFSESFSLDQRLVLFDLQVNRAYVRELGRAKVLKPAEVRELVRGLDKIRADIEGHPKWASGQKAEDVHTWVEARLEREIGSLAGKLRTGRSRNDLVATGTRLYLQSEISNLKSQITELLASLLSLAKRHQQVVLPGYTHLQPAQPILFAHYLLAYFEMFLRDASRLEDCRARADELPMGAGALAGTTFAIHRERLARELGFARVARNSLDVTCDRDFVCEMLFVGAMVMTHLSRLAEDLIIYSSPSFGFVELADAYSTGSSLMPQKKNPDSLELIRGRAARVIGRLTSSLVMLKGLPMAYNRDLQEDKAAIFDGLDTTRDSLVIAARVVGTLRINADKMKSATALGFLTATDVADELVRRGVTFADAHEQVGKLVRTCHAEKMIFDDVNDETARRFIPAWDAKLRTIATAPELAVARRDVTGGTAPRQVARHLRAAERAVRTFRRQPAR